MVVLLLLFICCVSAEEYIDNGRPQVNGCFGYSFRTTSDVLEDICAVYYFTGYMELYQFGHMQALLASRHTQCVQEPSTDVPDLNCTIVHTNRKCGRIYHSFGGMLGIQL